MLKKQANLVATAVFAVTCVWASAAHAQLSDRAEMIAQATAADVAQALGAVAAQPGEPALARGQVAQASATVNAQAQSARSEWASVIGEIKARQLVLEDEAVKTAAESSANGRVIVALERTAFELAAKVATLEKVARALQQANAQRVSVNPQRVKAFVSEDIRRTLCNLQARVTVLEDEGTLTAKEAREALIRSTVAQQAAERVEQGLDQLRADHTETRFMLAGLTGKWYLRLDGGLFDRPVAGLSLGGSWSGSITNLNAEVGVDGWWGGLRRLTGTLAYGETILVGASFSTIWLHGFKNTPNDIFVGGLAGLRLGKGTDWFVDLRGRFGAAQTGWAVDGQLGIGMRF